MKKNDATTLPFKQLSIGDIARVGGKNASLGEMLQQLQEQGIRVPDGFATTSDAYRAFIEHNKLTEPLRSMLERMHSGERSLAQTGHAIRQRFLRGQWPDHIRDDIISAYRQLAEDCGQPTPSVAVRSSATAEDLPEASFAGQQESYLNIRGEPALLEACRRCFASLFTNRAITYRENNGFDHLQVALSVGVQLMVRSDIGAAGVMFSIDTETGFEHAVLINANWGLGETVVQGSVEPDEYMVYKPLLDDTRLVPIIEKQLGKKQQKLVYSRSAEEPTRLRNTSRAERNSFVLSDADIVQLARWAKQVEAHYQKPMDMEWAKDGDTGELYMLQARPETVQSQRQAGALKTYTIRRKGRSRVTGHSIGQSIATGLVCKLASARDIDRFVDGAVLVTERTDPDWIPIMKRAAAIVTDQGGRTSHAAIVSRELGLPAIVGTGNAGAVLKQGEAVTVSCAEGEIGHVYEGIADYVEEEVSLDDIPDTRTKVMLILADPDAALRWWRLPADGVGLARMEFIINNSIKIHPMALLKPEQVTDRKAQRLIAQLTQGWSSGADYFVERLALGIARIAACQYPHQVIVRMSDFKTDEYANLIGGTAFEPREANPMLGWRGASRYYSEDYREGFALECRAILKVREVMGLDNVVVMIPFCRTLEEADKVLEEMRHNGLERGKNGLEVYVMCEIPSNVVLAEDFAQRFDGFSIGSNDLTQLTLGIDRDSTRLASLFNEQNPAVKQMISSVIQRVHSQGCHIGLCGQAPSDHPEFAQFLVQEGIDSISVNPDSFLKVKLRVEAAESKPNKR